MLRPEIGHLLEETDSPYALVIAIAKRARDYSLKHYYGKEFLKEVEEAYGYFAG